MVANKMLKINDIYVYRQRKRGNVAANASDVRKKTIAVIVLHAEMIKVIKYANKDAVRS